MSKLGFHVVRCVQRLLAIDKQMLRIIWFKSVYSLYENTLQKHSLCFSNMEVFLLLVAGCTPKLATVACISYITTLNYIS